MFLKIENKGTVSRKYYELIGATNKRERWDDSSVIGNKGSGAKLAVVPSLRLGYEVAVSSADSEGSYILKYKTQEADLGDRTSRQIVFDYVGSGSFPSQLTLDAFQDWSLPVGDDRIKIFKAFREYLVNAWDEDKDFTLKEVEAITQAEAGKTAAFITITDEIREIIDNLPRYFKFLGKNEPLHEAKRDYFFSGGAIYPKSEAGVTRFYSQGVLVDCKRSDYCSTLYDYSLMEKSLLSEERTIKDFLGFQTEIGKLLMTIEDPTLIIGIFQKMMGHTYANLELQVIGEIKDPPQNAKKIYLLAWMMHFGEKAILSVENTQVDEDAANKGFNVIRGSPYPLRVFLQRCGVTNAYDVAPKAKKAEEKPDYEIIELDEIQAQRFNEAQAIYLRHFPEAKKFPIYFFRPLHVTLEYCDGHCGVGVKQFKEIWIAEKTLSDVRRILAVLNHEGRHCKEQKGDYDRGFTQAADETIVDFMLAYPEPLKKNVWQANIQTKRGITIPKRFAGQMAHVLIYANEIRLKIGKNTLTALLPGNIAGQISQERRCGIFKSFATIFVPEAIVRQLPDSIAFEIR
jgi:hypothetical protein